MGIRLSIFEGKFPRFPHDIKMTLICDGEVHTQGDLLARGPDYQEFRSDDDFMGCYRDAMRAGWKDTHRGGRRVFLGPCCSGKEKADAGSCDD